MTTTADMIQQCRRHLFSGQAEAVNRLNGAVTSGVTSVALKFDLRGVVAGAIISAELEEILVLNVDSSSKTATEVVRGYNGTTAAAHADQTIVYVQPKFSDARILQAINDDLRDLSTPSSGLFQIKTTDITFNPARGGYDFPATAGQDVISIAELRYRQVGPLRSWPLIHKFALLRNMDGTQGTSDFPSNLAIVIYEGGYPGLPLHVRYKAPFSSLTTLTDDVVTVAGLPSSAHDLPPIGAFIRLSYPRDLKRSFSEQQGEPRRAEEVPVGATFASLRGMLALRQQRLIDEATRLARRYPPITGV